MKRACWLVPVVLLSGCAPAPKEKIVEEKPAAAVSATTVAVAAENWPAVYEAAGTVRARTSSVVSARLMGAVREVRVEAGDRVRQGQVLATLDSRDLDVNLKRSETAREALRSSIPEAESGIAAAKANLDFAQATFRRMQDLYEKKSISNQEFDEASARLKASQADYEMTKARRAQINARLAQAEQEVRASELVRTYAEVPAPFAGLVVARSVEPGVLASPGVPLFTIEREGTYRLEAQVEESKLGSIRVGQAVAVMLDSVDHGVDAKVVEIVPMVDAASHSYVVKIDLPVVASLRSGVFGRAVFQSGSRAVVSVPAGAVMEKGQLHSVFVAVDGLARTRLITTGRKSNDRVEVLSGLTMGEPVVFPVPAGLADGARLR